MLRRLALLGGVLALSACGGGAPEEETGTPNVIVYETRGRVEMLPEAALPMNDFLVHHEPIPGFKGNFSETTPAGMNSMVMPFPPGEGVDLDGVKIGDVLSLRFQVTYHSENGAVSGMTLLSYEELPADTRLDLGRVREPE